MDLQEQIRNIMEHPTATATRKRKHLSHIMLHLGDYSENAEELEAAYITIMECIEIVTNQEGYEKRMGKIKPLSIPNKRAEEAKQLREWKKKDKGADEKMLEDLLKYTQNKGESEAMTYNELNRVLEFLLMFNILTIFQVQEIRAKALPYCK